jgi:hypothetical protein
LQDVRRDAEESQALRRELLGELTEFRETCEEEFKNVSAGSEDIRERLQNTTADCEAILGKLESIEAELQEEN